MPVMGLLNVPPLIYKSIDRDLQTFKVVEDQSEGSKLLPNVGNKLPTNAKSSVVLIKYDLKTSDHVLRWC
jgi:hypothetical protein